MVGQFSVRRCISKARVKQNTIWLILEGAIDAQPGQFVMVWLPGIGEKPFSIASIDPFGLLVVDVGIFSHRLHELSVGEPVWIKGPLGKGFSIQGESFLMVGGGYGSAPLLPLAKAARNMQKRVDVCLGAKDKQGVLLSDDFERLGCDVFVSTDDGSMGEKGLVTLIVERAINTFQYDTLYACGPVGMLSALALICRQYQMDYQLSWEAYMRCGLGLCGSCEVPNSFDQALPVGWLACFDGPVFNQHWK